MYKRNVSKNIVFLDVLRNDTKVRVLCKAEICGQKVLDEIKRGSTKIHVGDIIRISGSFNSEENLFHAKHSIIHVEKWQDKSPDLAFKPHIPSNNDRKKAKIVEHDESLVSRHQRVIA